MGTGCVSGQPRQPLVQTTGLRHVLVPVGACLGRALLGFKVNVEEAITLVVSVGPGELILQAQMCIRDSYRVLRIARIVLEHGRL